jgi:hypothetical protein
MSSSLPRVGMGHNRIGSYEKLPDLKDISQMLKEEIQKLTIPDKSRKLPLTLS